MTESLPAAFAHITLPAVNAETQNALSLRRVLEDADPAAAAAHWEVQPEPETFGHGDLLNGLELGLTSGIMADPQLPHVRRAILTAEPTAGYRMGVALTATSLGEIIDAMSSYGYGSYAEAAVEHARRILEGRATNQTGDSELAQARRVLDDETVQSAIAGALMGRVVEPVANHSPQQLAKQAQTMLGRSSNTDFEFGYSSGQADLRAANTLINSASPGAVTTQRHVEDWLAEPAENSVRDVVYAAVTGRPGVRILAESGITAYVQGVRHALGYVAMVVNKTADGTLGSQPL